jgi:hypothetical protein
VGDCHKNQSADGGRCLRSYSIPLSKALCWRVAAHFRLWRPCSRLPGRSEERPESAQPAVWPTHVAGAHKRLCRVC